MSASLAKASVAGATFLGGIFIGAGAAVSADLSPFFRDWAYEPPACSSYYEKTYDNGKVKFLWCSSNLAPYEARLDAWKYANGRWDYYRTRHYDCQNADDYPYIPPITKGEVC